MTTTQIAASPLTTKPQHSGQPNTLCPGTHRVVFVPSGTIENEWRYCEACGSCHRVKFIGGDKLRPTLRCL